MLNESFGRMPVKSSSRAIVSVLALLTATPVASATEQPRPPALRVDAAAGVVVAMAQFCDLERSATVEFPIVGDKSDRGYEALFRTFASPGEIARALEGIGVPRGVNVNAATHDFWPRGERVAIDVAPADSDNAAWTPLQRYISDMETRAPLAFDSFVYCGSPDDPEPEKPGDRLADTAAPNAILSTYNERQTVLDIPARVAQSDVYGRFVLAPDHNLAPHGLYFIRFRPVRRPDGLPRVRNCVLRLSASDAGPALSLSEKGAPLCSGDAAAIATALADLERGGFDVFASVEFDGGLTLADAAVCARLVAAFEDAGSLRVKGPAPDAIYYKAFLPDEAWRVRKDRPSQPWELRVAATPGEPAAAHLTLVKTIEDWTDETSFEPRLTTREFAAASPAEAAATVEAEGAALPVLLAFAPADMRLADILPAILALKPRLPTLYVFSL